MASPMLPSPEVTIVGGGIIGLATAFELAERGLAVTVLEGGPAAGGGATRAAAGMLAPVSEADVETTPLLHLAQDSLRLYPDFVGRVEAAAEMHCDYRRDGTLWVALNRDDEEAQSHLATTLSAKGLQATYLERTALLEIEPRLTPRVQSGLLVTTDHQVDPRRMATALAAALQRRGGTLQTGITVHAITAAAKGWLVQGKNTHGESVALHSQKIVLAAGAWSSEGVRSPLKKLHVRPVKGQLVRLRGAPMVSHVLRGSHLYIVPRRDGELLIGATMEEQGFDTKPTAGAVMELLREAWLMLPGIYDFELLEVSVGHRPATADGMPIIGASDQAGLYIATGHFRNGVLLAPATAHYLAQVIADGAEPAELAPFALRPALHG